MAGAAEYQCFSVSGGHNLYPERLFPTFRGVKVFECPNMMDFDLVCEVRCPTDFTYLGEEPSL
jgi:hypothetical protein